MQTRRETLKHSVVVAGLLATAGYPGFAMAAFNKAGPVYIYASAQENIRIDFSGKQFTPSAPPHNVRGALAIELR